MSEHVVGAADDPAILGARAPAILLVDDDAPIVDAIGIFLARQGFRIETAQNGVEALAAIEREPPALILLDIHMPIMDGPRVMEELHARRIAIPVIVMTAASEAEGTAERVGATTHVSKPLSLPLLLAKIDRILE